MASQTLSHTRKHAPCSKVCYPELVLHLCNWCKACSEILRSRICAIPIWPSTNVTVLVLLTTTCELKQIKLSTTKCCFIAWCQSFSQKKNRVTFCLRWQCNAVDKLRHPEIVVTGNCCRLAWFVIRHQHYISRLSYVVSSFCKLSILCSCLTNFCYSNNFTTRDKCTHSAIW